METPTADTIRSVWTLTLIVFVVVLIVVATLLTLILRTARAIKGGTAIIWNVGQGIANNTVQLSQLAKTNAAVNEIFTAAVGVIGATAAVRDHAGECPGCPRCVLAPGWQR